MVGGFPCESLFEFLQEVLLNFDSEMSHRSA
jgi:hypothetical protein